MKKAHVYLILAAAVIGLGVYFYLDYRKSLAEAYPKFYSGNGRFEATEVYISTRVAERIEKVFVKEGDLVRKGDKLVQMRTAILEADKAAATAEILIQEGNLAMAKATVRKKESSFAGAEKEYVRQKTLIHSKAASQKTFDKTETEYKNALADLEYAKASVTAAEGSLASAKAKLQNINEKIKDSLLIAPYDGRIQYLLAHEGETLSAGGRAMNLVDLTDTYMTFFLPTKIAGLVQPGAEVKLIFDAAPDCAFNAKVSFIDPVAQFTPKSVETKVEREKLMFRIKAKIDSKLTGKYIETIKTGLPGVAWVKLDPKADWKESPVQVKEEY